MRVVIIFLGLALSGPGWASEDSPEPASSSESTPPSLPPHDAPADAEEPQEAHRAQTALWEFDYHQGVATTKTGMTIGMAGLIAGVGGVGLAVASVGLDGGGINEGALVGLLVAGLGLLSIQVGAPVAAVGTMKSHRALVDGGQAERGCGACVGSILLSVPNPLSIFTLPVSYSMTSIQKRSAQYRYERYKGWPSSSMKMQIMPGGVGVSGQF